MRVALFVPCFVDQLAPGVGIATARILSRLGHAVHYPEDHLGLQNVLRKIALNP